MWGYAALVCFLDTIISYLANTNNRQVLFRDTWNAVVTSLCTRLVEYLSMWLLIKISDWDTHVVIASAIGLAVGDAIASKWPNFGKKKKRKPKPAITEDMANI